MPESSIIRLPIFPIDHVLLPGLTLPMHIFEPRYRQLIVDVTPTSGEARARFGIVQARNSIAATGSAEHAEIGTLAEILERVPYEDGSFDLLTGGIRRFRILNLDDASKPYLQAEVEWLDDVDGGVTPELIGTAQALTIGYQNRLSALGGPVSYGADDRDDPLSADPVRASYEITSRLQLPMDQRQELLAADTVAERLRMAITTLRRESVLMDHTSTVPIHPQSLRIVATPN